MQSRKAWRNRDAGSTEAVLGLLEGLRHGLGADAVGLFDDDRAGGEGDEPGLDFWDSFGDQPCAPADWVGWYRTLRAEGRVDTTCRCGGAHRLRGFMVHDRWALLLVVPAALPLEGAAAIASSLRALSDVLPGAMTPDEARQAELARELEGPSHAPPATDAPVWWVRKRPA